MDFTLNNKETEQDEKKDNPFVIYGGPLLDGKGNLFENGCLYIEDGKIVLIGTEEDIFPNIPKDRKTEVIDTQGKVIFPGLINMHHHFYSALSKGLAPQAPPSNFQTRLENLWWKLDKALDKETVQLSALISLLESVRYGVTTIFDHHSSPNEIDGSLQLVSTAVQKTGIEACLCFEISGRNGKGVFQDSLEENLSFIRSCENNRTIKGVFGLHANFTLPENSIKKIATAFDPEIGIHIHCAEDQSDKSFCVDMGYKGAIDRLNKFNLLTSKAILAHGIHLSRHDITLLEKSQALLVHNPESNANNHVGRLKQPIARGVLTGLGTDGFSNSMLQTLRAGYLLHRQAGTSEKILFNSLPKFLFKNNPEFAGRFFPGKPGILEKGSDADVVVFDYVPTTPFRSNNIDGHIIFGMHNARASTVIAKGKLIYKDGTFMTLDEKLILDEAKKASVRLWDKYSKG